VADFANHTSFNPEVLLVAVFCSRCPSGAQFGRPDQMPACPNLDCGDWVARSRSYTMAGSRDCVTATNLQLHATPTSPSLCPLGLVRCLFVLGTRELNRGNGRKPSYKTRQPCSFAFNFNNYSSFKINFDDSDKKTTLYLTSSYVCLKLSNFNRPPGRFFPFRVVAWAIKSLGTKKKGWKWPRGRARGM
jgi:hypothetical protein